MPKKLRLLILEDAPADAELAVSALEATGYTCTWERVDSREDFLKQLESSKYDIVLSDYNLPAFDGLRAVKLFAELELDIPFLLISGSLGEEAAIETLKAGASDFVLKDKMYRLSFAVERALREFEVQRLRKRAESEQKIISEIIQGSIVTENLEGFLKLVHHSISQLVYAENCRVMLHDTANDMIYYEFWADKYDAIHPPRKIDKGFGSYILRTGQPILLSDESIKSICESGEAERIGSLSESWIGVPLRTPSRTIGVLILQHYEDQDVYDQRDLDFLTLVGDQIALAIERKRAQDALGDSEERYRDLVENAIDIIFTLDLKGNYTSVNQASENITGYTKKEARTMNVNQVVAPEYRKMASQKIAGLLSGQDVPPYDLEILAKDGRRATVEVSTRVMLENSIPVGIQGIARDITRRKRDEELLRESEAKFRTLFDLVPMAVYTCDLSFKIQAYNQAAVKLWGRDPAVGEPADIFSGSHMLFDKNDNEISSDQSPMAQVLRGQIPGGYDVEVTIRSPEGPVRNVIVNPRPLKDSSGRIVGAINCVYDITDQKKARAELAELSEQTERRERMLTTMLSATTDFFYLHDKEGRFLFANKSLLELWGVTLEDAIGKNVFDLGYPKESAEKLLGEILEVVKTKKHFSGETPYLDQEGRTGFYEYVCSPVFAADGSVDFVVGSSRDITERKNSAASLAESEQSLKLATESAKLGIWDWDLVTGVMKWDPKMYELYGITDPAMFSSAYDAWQDRLHPEDRPRGDAEIAAAIAGESDFHTEFRVCLPDGEIRHIEARALVMLSNAGVAKRMIGVNWDITERKRLEDQLAQSQKLESVGQLAGGIAHDFNNMLTAIIGYSELVLRRMSADDPVRKNVEEIKKAGERSALLTNQLLAFSRRQVLQPQVISINDVINDTSNLLTRLIGEDVELATALKPNAGMIKFDPGQLGQVLINLAVNARDAMPDGGKLTIGTSNLFIDPKHAHAHIGLLPGAYVLLSVSDDGVGIDPEVMEHIFEPFFTTKGIGKGTGLGLAMVYGIVKQSGGGIFVYSERGLGTAFKVYIPRVVATESETEDVDVPQNLVFGNERILLVEDEDLVRSLSRQILEACGYTVAEAQNGVEALEIVRSAESRFDLVITDVVMPQMGGRELAERLQEIEPDLPMLFSSGYPDDAIIRHGVLHTNLNYLQKPFTIEEVARKVRELLDKSAL